jgi:beta-RFAP synthase
MSMGGAEKLSEAESAVRISTGARLHFGLFDVKSPFGGVGMMVDHPRTTVTVSQSDNFETKPCQVDRLTEIAQRVAKNLPASQTHSGLPKCKVTVEAAADSHCGLGSGTQLALAATTAFSEFFGIAASRDELIFELAGRGKRSSVGSIGFFAGGLISESGDIPAGGFSSLPKTSSGWKRTTLPEDWRVVLACPKSDSTCVYGEAEGAAFATLQAATAEHRADLVKLSEAILGASAMGDFDEFCLSVGKFNRLSGELFSLIQGGCYNGQAVNQLVKRLESLGADGAGQSSWGPSVFGFCKTEVEAKAICESLDEIACRVVKPTRTGYSVERIPSTSCK